MTHDLRARNDLAACLMTAAILEDKVLLDASTNCTRDNDWALVPRDSLYCGILSCASGRQAMVRFEATHWMTARRH